MDAITAIRNKLGHLQFNKGGAPSLWLDTGIPDLNNVIGHRDHGLAYGHFVEITGMESHGKTAIALSLAALAQRDGAHVVWADFENSWKDDWAAVRGLVRGDKMTLLQPYVGTFYKEKEPRLISGPELLAEAESVIPLLSKKFDRMVFVVDSLVSILPEGEDAAGIDGANLRTDQDLPKLLGRFCRRWVGRAQAYNVLVILINQLRENPMQRFGNPWYTPGGNAPRFYSHVRVRVTRVVGSKIIERGKVIGIKGVMKANKNKLGGLEGAEVGYKLMFKGPIKFVNVKQVRADKPAES